MKVRQCVFLVGGRGSRLGAYTAETPKPLLDVAGRPFLDHLIDNARRFGIDRFILLGGYQAAKLLDHYRGRDAGIEIIVEPDAAGTAGALRYAAERLDPMFYMCNGDSFFDCNLLDLVGEPLPDRWTARIALRRVDDGARYGSVAREGDRIVSFGEKGQAGPADINAGIYLFKREILSQIGTMPCSMEQQVFPALVQAGLLYGRAYQGNFIDIGIPESLSQAREEFARFLTRPAVFLPIGWVVSQVDGSLQVDAEAASCIKLCNDRNHLVFLFPDSLDLAGAPVGNDEVLALVNNQLLSSGGHVDAMVGDSTDAQSQRRYLEESSFCIARPDYRPDPGYGTALPLVPGSILKILDGLIEPYLIEARQSIAAQHP